ncbi:MAG: adenylate/guanylate cyclase domain-containing protein [Bacteroidales bacterium]|nr:adenylate/guanylate cyclase domain-containing protein [Bacteroidales bacterium]
MVEYIHFRDPESKEMKEKLQTLPKCSGTCIFIDLVNSTGIKYTHGIAEWGCLLNNTFNIINLLNDFPENIVKGIGDELMLFIPDDVLFAKKNINDYFSLLFELYATLDNIKNFPLEGLFIDCKVGIHYCTEVYNITFFEGFNDYYGIDIDLSARVMSQSKANTIVLSESYYNKVYEDYQLKEQYRSEKLLSMISQKSSVSFKGVPHLTDIRFLEV